VRAVLSLGSNLGDRRAHLAAGLSVLGQRLPLQSVSPVYETAPVGGPTQPPYLNCVAFAAVDEPLAALSAAHAAESVRGRLRSTRWGPRTLDVDVISVDCVVRADSDFTLPHPRAHERAFVLAPWLDLDPDAFLPGRGPVWWLLRKLDRTGVRRVVS
jgi:2-amino-4-hydroxy-6-hydroxymethyldihydropteridine diphosphokinase